MQDARVQSNTPQCNNITQLPSMFLAVPEFVGRAAAAAAPTAATTTLNAKESFSLANVVAPEYMTAIG